MKSHMTRVFFRSALATALALLMLAATANAQTGTQSTSSTQQLEVAEAGPGQIQTAPVVQAPAQIPPARWTQYGSFEGDTHGNGYGGFGPTYVKPFRPNMAWVAGANLNYLYYEYPSGTGLTRVQSPGVNVRGGVQFGQRNTLALTAGPSFKRRHTEVLDASDRVMQSSKDLKVGVNLGAELWTQPTSHNSISGGLSYGAVDKYTWSRLAYSEQITNRDWSGKFAHYVGASFSLQGSEDIRTLQVGPFVEFSHVPTRISMSLSAGYKRSTFVTGPAKTGPWFAIGFWQRLR